jgi:hypothetical protein
MSLRVRGSMVVLMLCVAVVAAAGCGKAVGAGDDAADDGGDDPGEDDAGDDGTDDGGVDAGGDGADASPLDENKGLVHVFARNYTRGGDIVLESTITARFGAYETEVCSVVLAGSQCRVLDCDGRDAPSPSPDAGNITIEGLQDAALMPDGDGAYAPVELPAVILSEGGPVSALSTGGEVPAFDIIDLTGPYSIGFQSGVPTSAGSISISASEDYTLFWGGIVQTETVKISLSGARGGNGVRRLLVCNLLAGAGEVTFSSEALALLPQGELAFEARTETSATAMAGDHEITLTAAAVARLGDDAAGDWASGTVMLTP